MYLRFSIQYEDKNHTNNFEVGQSSTQGYFHALPPECELEEAFFKYENDWFSLQIHNVLFGDEKIT